VSESEKNLRHVETLTVSTTSDRCTSVMYTCQFTGLYNTQNEHQSYNADTMCVYDSVPITIY